MLIHTEDGYTLYERMPKREFSDGTRQTSEARRIYIEVDPHDMQDPWKAKRIQRELDDLEDDDEDRAAFDARVNEDEAFPFGVLKYRDKDGKVRTMKKVGMTFYIGFARLYREEEKTRCYISNSFPIDDAEMVERLCRQYDEACGLAPEQKEERKNNASSRACEGRYALVGSDLLIVSDAGKLLDRYALCGSLVPWGQYAFDLAKDSDPFGFRQNVAERVRRELLEEKLKTASSVQESYDRLRVDGQSDGQRNNDEKNSFSVGEDVYEHVVPSNGKEFPFARVYVCKATKVAAVFIQPWNFASRDELNGTVRDVVEVLHNSRIYKNLRREQLGNGQVDWQIKLFGER